MKVDKEFLLKNRFWIALGVFAPLWLIALLVVFFGASSAVGEGQTKIKQAQDKLNISNPKNDNFVRPLVEKKDTLQKQKDKVWQQAWQTQTQLMTWPDIGSRQHLESQGRFGDEVPYGDLQDFIKSSNYAAQMPVDDIRKMMQPIEGNWEGLIKRATFKDTPTSEEAWLAQEDLWVQRELLNVVRAAYDSVARFDNLAVLRPVDVLVDDEPAPAAEAAGAAGGAAAAAPSFAGEPRPKGPPPIRRRYRNALWQLDLVLEQNDKREASLGAQTRLTNVSPDRQPLPVAGLTFGLAQLVQSGQPPVTAALTFDAKEPLRPGGVVLLKKPQPLPKFVASYPVDVRIAADPSAPVPAGASARHRFRSPNWELDLIVERDPKAGTVLSPKSTIRNVHVSGRRLALAEALFRVSQGSKGSAEVRIQEEALVYGQTMEFKRAIPVPVFDPAMPLEVEQVFTWATSPIKRLDALELSYPSHKIAHLPLKPAEQFTKPADPSQPAATDTGMGGMGGMGGAMGMPPGYPGMGGGAMGGPPMPSMPRGGKFGGMSVGGGGPGGGTGRAFGDGTPNGLERNRYIYVSPQVRRMPVALALVMDQAYVQDFLTAVMNSRLRIQINQVQWGHVEGVRPGMLAAGPGPAGGRGGPGGPGLLGGMEMGGGGMRPPTPAVGGSMGGPPMPGKFGGGFPSPGGPAMGTPGMGTPGMETGADETDPNLVEIAVYGIASLYERYPPREPAAGSTGTPGAPAAFAAPALPGGTPVAPVTPAPTGPSSPAAPVAPAGATPAAPAGTAPAGTAPAGSTPAGTVPPATPPAAPGATPPATAPAAPPGSAPGAPPEK